MGKIKGLEKKLLQSPATVGGEMGKHVRLFQRGSGWTFRAWVPEDIRPIIGKKEIWKSLGAVSHREATRLACIESVRIDALFAAARERLEVGTRADKVSDEELEHLARSYLHHLEVQSPPVPFSDSAREARRDHAQEEAAIIAQGVEDAGLQQVALSVARESKLVPIIEGETLVKVTAAVQRALLEHYSRDTDRAEMRPERVFDSLFTGVTRDGPAPASPITLKRAVEMFLSAPEHTSLAPKTLAGYTFRLALFIDIIGASKPVVDITRADIRDARDVLLKLPPNSTKRWPKTSARDVAALAEREGIAGISPKSAKLYLETLSSLFRWMEGEDLVVKNLAKGVKGTPVPEETERRPFTIDELNSLYAAPAFAALQGKGWLYWLPRVALFSGARFTELLGLKASDVVEVEGVPVIHIQPNDIRPLKTKGSKRLMPIHPELVRLGLLDHVKSVPANGALFPDAATDGNWLLGCNHTMSRRLRAIIADTGVVFHSFRHTFKDAAERAEIPREVIAELGGWDMPGGKSAMDGYGKAKLVKRLADALARVSYPTVRL